MFLLFGYFFPWKMNIVPIELHLLIVLIWHWKCLIVSCKMTKVTNMMHLCSQSKLCFENSTYLTNYHRRMRFSISVAVLANFYIHITDFVPHALFLHYSLSFTQKLIMLDNATLECKGFHALIAERP